MAESALASRLAQLNQARKLVDSDASYFPQIVVGVLPVFDDPSVELRRWVADFVLVAFSCTKLSMDEKENLGLQCLERLTVCIAKETDQQTSKNFIQISTVLYPLIMRHVTINPQSEQIWRKIEALKRSIIILWQSTHLGIRVSCTKFVQRVIAAQSPGIKDPRLASRNDVSLSSVVADHPLLDIDALSAEADALLSQLVSILLERSASPALLTAVLNCLCVLAKTRISLSSRIISTILSLDTSSVYDDQDTAKNRLQIRCLDKAIRITLTHLLKANAAGPFGHRIQQFLLGRARKSEEENPKKRQASESAENTGKRLRTDVDGPVTPQPSILHIPPLPDGVVTLATIYNLANDNALASFDVKQLPQELIVQIVLATLGAVNEEHLDSSIQAIRSRHSAMQDRAFQSTSSVIQKAIEVPIDSPPQAGVKEIETHSSGLPVPGPFSMPEPTKVPDEVMQQYVLDYTGKLTRSSSSIIKRASAMPSHHGLGFHRLHGAAWDRETWMSLTIRLITRGLPLAEVYSSAEFRENSAELAVRLRVSMLAYVMENFRDRMDFCASWLNEEWYSLRMKHHNRAFSDTAGQGQYEFLVHQVMDAMLPFLESKDRSFMRFMSDLPELTTSTIAKLRVLCEDPDRSQLGYMTLQYLIMLRPPVRSICLDMVQKLHAEDKSEVTQQEKILNRWRPSAVVKAEGN